MEIHSVTESKITQVTIIHKTKRTEGYPEWIPLGVFIEYGLGRLFQLLLASFSLF